MARHKRRLVPISVIQKAILNYLKKMTPGVETGFWEIMRAVSDTIEHDYTSKDEEYPGIGIERMQDMLKRLESVGKVGWAMATGQGVYPHYYLVAHRKANPEIAHDWIYSEYIKGEHHAFPRVSEQQSITTDDDAVTFRQGDASISGKASETPDGNLHIVLDPSLKQG